MESEGLEAKVPAAIRNREILYTPGELLKTLQPCSDSRAQVQARETR
jgi:hypothetical protein